MSDVTAILGAAAGDRLATEKLLPLVYDELRRLAAYKLQHESPGQTLEPTALVHEAYLRLMEDASRWDSRRHFFAAASEAMRRILVESARRKAAEKHGGQCERESLGEAEIAAPQRPEELLIVDEALDRLEQADPLAAELVKLRYFSGLTIPQAAELLDVSPRTADRIWAYARAWLFREIGAEHSGLSPAAGE